MGDRQESGRELSAAQRREILKLIVDELKDARRRAIAAGYSEAAVDELIASAKERLQGMR